MTHEDAVTSVGRVDDVLQSDEVTRCNRCGCGGCYTGCGSGDDPLRLTGASSSGCVLHGDPSETFTQHGRDDLVDIDDRIALQLLRDADKSGRVVVGSQRETLEDRVGLRVGGKVVSFCDENTRHGGIVTDRKEHIFAAGSCDRVGVGEHWRGREHG